MTPLSLRRGVRAGAIGVLLLGGLNILGVVGLRNGALGIPFSGAVRADRGINITFVCCFVTIDRNEETFKGRSDESYSWCQSFSPALFLWSGTALLLSSLIAGPSLWL